MTGIIIADLLTKSEPLLALVPESSIFPYVADENTPLPLIIYTIDTVVPEYSKDGWIGDMVGFSVMSFSEDYAILQAIVLEVREALELEYDAKSQRIILTGQQEVYNINEDVFMNRQSFSVLINKK